MNEEEIIEIFETLVDSVKTRGLDKTKQLLYVEKPKDFKPQLNDYERYVIDTVVKAFKIDVEDLFYGRYRRGNYKYAIGCCVHFLYEIQTLGEIQKKIFKNKNKSLLSKYRNDVLDLNEKTNPEYYSKIQALAKKIKKYKNQINEHSGKQSATTTATSSTTAKEL